MLLKCKKYHKLPNKHLLKMNVNTNLSKTPLKYIE